LRELFLRNNEGISDNAIVDVTGLQNLTKLWTLDLRRNQIASLAPLLTNPSFACEQHIGHLGPVGHDGPRDAEPQPQQHHRL